MKLIGNIEVSGITRIVFYNTGEAWIRSEPDEDGANIYWFLEDDISPGKVRDHQIMMNIVQRKIWDPSNWRIWIHGETMNIEPVE
jgi:hypothetical protein